REPALHVSGASPEEEIIAAAGFEGRGGPQSRLLGGDDIDVTVEQQPRTAALSGATDDVVPARVRGLRDAREGVVADPLRDRDALDLEAEALQFLLDDELSFVLLSDRARSRHETLEEREGGLRPLGDRGVELIEVQTRTCSMVECLVQIPLRGPYTCSLDRASRPGYITGRLNNRGVE